MSVQSLGDPHKERGSSPAASPCPCSWNCSPSSGSGVELTIPNALKAAPLGQVAPAAAQQEEEEEDPEIEKEKSPLEAAPLPSGAPVAAL